MEVNQKKIGQIAEKYNLLLLLFFGSQVKGRKFSIGRSDIDVAYLSERELNGEEMINLNCDLIDVFKNDRVDMVDLKKADPFLRYEIAKNSKLLFGNEIDYLEVKALAFKDYISHQPLFELEDFLIRKRQKLLKEFIYGK